MDIKRFTKREFGTLTTITNYDTGSIMFLGVEIAEMWGHTNLSQSISRLLNEDEYKKIKLSKFKEFRDQLVSNNLLSAKSRSAIFITESGLYKLALSSNLDKAKPFKEWITREVLPSIRSKGYYSIADQTEKIMIHTDKSIQKQNSKEINSKNWIEGGLQSVIDYNRQSCLLHTGKTTKEIKQFGKNVGLKSKDRNSAKEVLRHTAPEIACGMSFTDDLVKAGFDLKTVSDLSKKSAIPLFKGMIELGIKPKELND